MRAFLAAMSVVGLLSGCGPSPAPQAGPGEDIAAGEPTTPNVVVPTTAWRYSDDKDPMTDKLTRFACVRSTNEAQLDRPYENVPAQLCIRQSPTTGLSVYVGLDGDGQIICRSYRECSFPIRFGDSAATSFSGAEPGDGSSNVVFITNGSRFVQNVKDAPVTRIELTFYQAGNQVLEFPTADLEWPRPDPPAAAAN